MRRKLLVLFSVLAVAVVTFVGVSRALAPAPALPHGYSVSELPAMSLPSATQLKIGGLISAHAATRFGITSDSYRQARRLALTSAGPLYVIPGTQGLCVALRAAVSCGQPSASEPTVSVFVTAPASKFMVGGGVTPDGTTQVLVKPQVGPALPVQIVKGGFVVSEQAKLRPHRQIAISAR
jgi:hypothetical protein